MSGDAGPRRLDPHQMLRVQPRTLETYRREARLFTEWAYATRVSPIGADQWDDALVEYKNACFESLSPAKFCSLLAAADFFFLRVKGHLSWAPRRPKGLGARTYN